MNRNKKLPKNLINHKIIEYKENFDLISLTTNNTQPSIVEEVIESLTIINPDIIKTSEVIEQISEKNNGEIPTQEANIFIKEKMKYRKGFWNRHREEDVILIDDTSEHEVRKEEKEMSLRKTADSTIEAAVVSSTMVVKGDVELETSLVLNGKINGNIKCKDVIEASFGSYIEGNIEAKSVKFSGSELKGNISVEDFIEANNQTKVNGNIIARRCEISGHVNGEINASESLVLKNTAVVKGDIFSASISIEAGAQIEGKVTTILNSSKQIDSDN